MAGMSREFELPLLFEDLGMYFVIGKKDNFALYFLRAENKTEHFHKIKKCCNNPKY